MSDRAREIDRPAKRPDADLACDFTIALSEVGLRDRLAALVLEPANRISGGISISFRPEAWDTVRRYIETESECCPFLSLSARRTPEATLLTVTGRADAQDLIGEMFGIARDASG